jgi:hypothetical protein
MKTKTLILFSILIFQIFSPFAAQTLAQTTANIDFNDSDDFFKNTVRRPRPVRDNSQKIEALLRKMTFEEKVMREVIVLHQAPRMFPTNGDNDFIYLPKIVFIKYFWRNAV